MAVGDWEVNQGSEGSQKSCTDTGSVYMSTPNIPLKQQQQQQHSHKFFFFLNFGCTVLTWDLIKSSLTKSGTRLKWLGSSSSNQGSSLCPLQWKCRVLTTGLLEISQCCWVFLLLLFLLLLSSLWIFCELFLLYWGRASLVAQTVKNLPAVQEIWVWSLGWEDPLEKGMTTHSRIVA